MIKSKQMLWPSLLLSGVAWAQTPMDTDDDGLISFAEFQARSEERFSSLDSDGDGVPNGVELGDPDGSWTAGSDQPGDAALITHPGDSSSFIEIMTAVGEASWASVKAIVRGQQ